MPFGGVVAGEGGLSLARDPETAQDVTPSDTPAVVDNDEVSSA